MFDISTPGSGKCVLERFTLVGALVNGDRGVQHLLGVVPPRLADQGIALDPLVPRDEIVVLRFLENRENELNGQCSRSRRL